MTTLDSDEALSTNLQKECAIIEWSMLKPHYDRGALIIVKEGLDIISAGVQIAQNNTQLVEQWIADQTLIKPTPEQVIEWGQDNRSFRSVVVAPFVLMQTVSH